MTRQQRAARALDAWRVARESLRMARYWLGAARLQVERGDPEHAWLCIVNAKIDRDNWRAFRARAWRLAGSP